MVHFGIDYQDGKSELYQNFVLAPCQIWLAHLNFALNETWLDFVSLWLQPKYTCKLIGTKTLFFFIYVACLTGYL
jgi:hypothetical protein